MNVIELKKELKEQIQEIEDIGFLRELKRILDSRKSGNFIFLTEELEEELLSASEEGKKGNHYSQSDMDSIVEEWIKGK